MSRISFGLFIIATGAILIISTSANPLSTTTPNSDQSTTLQPLNKKKSRQFLSSASDDTDFNTFLLVSPQNPFDYSNIHPSHHSDEDRIVEIVPNEDVEITNPDFLEKNGEVMHTAENIVFRPIFSYKKIQEKRRRLNGNSHKYQSTASPNSIRRVSYLSQPQRVYPYYGNQYPRYQSAQYYYPYY